MTVPEIDVDTLDTLGSTAVQLIDVREPEEYDQARVRGARLVPLATVPASLDELDTTKPLYLICASGQRSAQAAEWLAAQGFESVNVAGGTKAWVAAGKPFDTGPVGTR